MPAKPECPYCGTTEGLRQLHDGGGWIEPEYSCEACFTSSDDGACFDDLPTVPSPLNERAMLVRALELAVGTLQAAAVTYSIPEQESTRFIGKWERYGTVTLAEVLDAANAALSEAALAQARKE